MAAKNLETPTGGLTSAKLPKSQPKIDTRREAAREAGIGKQTRGRLTFPAHISKCRCACSPEVSTDLRHPRRRLSNDAARCGFDCEETRFHRRIMPGIAVAQIVGKRPRMSFALAVERPGFPPVRLPHPRPTIPPMKRIARFFRTCRTRLWNRVFLGAWRPYACSRPSLAQLEELSEKLRKNRNH
jgi:hypothetical protein